MTDTDLQLSCIIIDDEPLARELLESYVDRTPFLTCTGSYASPADAIKAIVAGTADIVFLDINMPCLNGIEFAQIIPQTTRIIYVTAYEQYAVQAFRNNALDYLLKPVNYAEFMTAVRRAAEWRTMARAIAATANDERRFIIVKSDYKTVQLPLDSILYIEGQKDYVRFVLADPQPPVVSLINLKTLEQYLPVSRFLRVHRSFIVNTDKITTIDRNRLVFGSTFVPISESYRDNVQAYLRRHSVL